MYVTCVGMNMTPQWAIPKTASQQERSLNSFPRIGFVRYAALARTSSVKNR